MDRTNFRRALAQQLRVDSIRASDAGGSGHPTSSMSAADLMAVLLDGHLCLDFDNPDDPRRDHLIFSKGHASPLLYACYRAAGAIDEDELLTFRKLDSRLEGHPTPAIPWVDVATGSLGQGLPVGVGLALAGKRLDRLPYRVWVLCGDSEMAEGSMWEAFEHASHERLDNLTAIIDVNRLGQTGETMLGWDLDAYADRARAFGWEAVTIDGHDLDAIDDALAHATRVSDRPTVVIARTKKGRGVEEVEDLPDFHGKPLKHPQEAIEELGGPSDLRVEVRAPEGEGEPHRFEVAGGELPRYELGEEVATRKAYGEALKALGDRRGDVVALDGEVSNSTYSEIFRDAHPERYLEMYIAEQQMVAAAVGIQSRGWTAFASTFAAFFSRAYDFVRMAAISRANLRLAGSHAGVAIGEDGPSQMALEDLAAFRAVRDSTVLYPCDANQAARLVELMADREGISYLRTSRGAMPVIYEADESFAIGGSRVVREGDDVTLVGAGVTLHEALAAAERLAEEGIDARVIDLYSIKPVDADTLRAAAAATGAVVTAEDHWPEGGLGDAVLGALAELDEIVRVRKLGVSTMPTSGEPAQLLRAAEIDAEAIASAARELVRAGDLTRPERTTMNRLREIEALGQAIWLDNLSRQLIDGGELQSLIEDDGLSGVTSNPTIFEKAMGHSDRYDDALREALDETREPEEIFLQLAYADVRDAADMLHPTFDRTQGQDGYVSFELPASLAHDTEGSIEQAERHRDAIDRPNVLIKVPGTAEGVPAFEELTARGVNVNVTLLFAVTRYEEVAEAYLRALERRVEAGESIERNASVASFFVSRVDDKVDAALDELGRPELKGRAAVANAKLAYASFQRIFAGERWEALRARGANVQRPLWGSTSTKNPDYSDTLYVDELIGPDTVNTMPDATLEAARERATATRTLDRDVDDARELMRTVSEAGVDVDDIVERQLVEEGVDAFADSYASLLETLTEKARELTPAAS